ncbi:Wzz/FepE/Etk N-terminal domain-containing protein [Pseudomonas sp. CC120222-01a]|uniref:Wzz/FepE/Etk N-terminal domain-containing protein n=1 Tax=Pseudomonas sp. CC120222-01a TaxID=1378075 RepID=UPI000D88EBF3|nr:Wzz/FepE/Etk N-terminal domain-containing protein [Pseudomonas sp. CC120222-01a]PVZ32922.1 chain length determinant protein (polysaccharide antigen chain regulator) [Pseudomonas sp. CC120222-01a]
MRDGNELLVSGEEIGLARILRAIWRKKLVVLLSAVIVSSMAIAYGFMAVPVYVAKVILQPPIQSDIVPFNYGRGENTGLKELTVTEVYNVYLRNLQSDSLRRKFFKEVYRPGLNKGEGVGSRADDYERLQRSLSLGPVSNDDKSRYFISIEATDPALAMAWAVKYSELAGQLSQVELTQDLQTDAREKARNLHDEIKADLEGARMEREDRIVRLEEALRIARLAGLQKPPITSTAPSREVSAAMDGSLMYMRGAEALEAEVANLRSRDSDEPFVHGLRPRQQSMVFYQTLKLNLDGAKVYRQDGVGELPDSPLRPNRPWVFVLGLLAGVVLGCVIAGWLGLKVGSRGDGVKGA